MKTGHWEVANDPKEPEKQWLERAAPNGDLLVIDLDTSANDEFYVARIYMVDDAVEAEIRRLQGEVHGLRERCAVLHIAHFHSGYESMDPEAAVIEGQTDYMNMEPERRRAIEREACGDLA